jgi:hypothetical protein
LLLGQFVIGEGGCGGGLLLSRGEGRGVGGGWGRLGGGLCYGGGEFDRGSGVRGATGLGFHPQPTVLQESGGRALVGVGFWWGAGCRGEG